MSIERIKNMTPDEFERYISNISSSNFEKLIQPNLQPSTTWLLKANDLYILQCIYEKYDVDLFPLLRKVSMETILSLYGDKMTYQILINNLLKLYINIINNHDEITIINGLTCDKHHPANICNFIIMCIIK